MSIYKLSSGGSVTKPRTEFKSMNTGVQFGAMVPIANAANGSANFFNIPGTYQDLYITGQLRGVNANTIEYSNITLNGISSGYSYTMLGGDGSSAFSSRTNYGTGAFFLGVIPGGNSTANVFGSYQIWVLNYASTTTFKTVIWRLAADQNGTGETRSGVGLLQTTSPVTSFNVFGSNGSAIGTTHSLYGIRASNA